MTLTPYQRGDRIALVATTDPYTRLTPGTQGTVIRYDPGQGQFSDRHVPHYASELVFCVTDMSVTLTGRPGGRSVRGLGHAVCCTLITVRVPLASAAVHDGLIGTGPAFGGGAGPAEAVHQRFGLPPVHRDGRGPQLVVGRYLLRSPRDDESPAAAEHAYLARLLAPKRRAEYRSASAGDSRPSGEAPVHRCPLDRGIRAR
jgi:hypothetical protein